jgi:glucokinase
MIRDDDYVLAGDVGGTHLRLALFRGRGETPRPEFLEILPCRNYRGLTEALRDYLGRRNFPVTRACLGVAGVIIKGRMEMVNLGWTAAESDVARELGFGELTFINDLEANAHGIEALAPADFRVLSEGEDDPHGNRCLISAGTGLGEAGMIRTSAGYVPFHSEGGHADFGPRNETEADLLRYLEARHGHVSWERILSGPGLASLHAFLRDTGRGTEPAWLAERMRSEDPGKVVTQTGLSGEADICRDALDIFTSIYGAEAGNLALKLLATGGVYIGGGIAPKILPKLEDGAFLRAFHAKGRLRSVLEKIPVKVILNDHAALLGAARVALGMARRRLSAVSPSA